MAFHIHHVGAITIPTALSLLPELKSRVPPYSGKHLAKGKGVHREVESKGSSRQTSSLTNRNHIRGDDLGKGYKRS